MACILCLLTFYAPCVLIQYLQVTKTYPESHFSLADIDFQIADGEFVFLIGPSGSGKTTLIKMLIREEFPTSGKIYFDDVDITGLSRSRVYKLRRQIGVVFQDYKLIPDKNTYENVAFAMEVAGRSDKEIEETVPYVLDIVGLTERSGAFPEQLSGGEKQRVAIARAVANNPRVLIADEPTGNLDPASAWDIVQILSKINNWGTTVIMSTHGTDIVNTLHKRVIQIDKGTVIRDDSTGVYETTSQFEQQTVNNLEGSLEAVQPALPVAHKKGPIKVKLDTTEPAEAEEKGKLHTVLQRLGIIGKKAVQEASALEPPAVQEEMSVVSEPALTPEEEAVISKLEKEKLTEKEAEKIAKEADRTPLEQLELRPEIIADLVSAGYHDVEDLITAGPENLSQQLVIDPEEVIEVAKALGKFVIKEEKEGEAQQEGKKSPGEDANSPKPEKKEEAKPKKPKLNLTAKKSKH